VSWQESGRGGIRGEKECGGGHEKIL